MIVIVVIVIDIVMLINILCLIFPRHSCTLCTNTMVQYKRTIAHANEDLGLRS